MYVTCEVSDPGQQVAQEFQEKASESETAEDKKVKLQFTAAKVPPLCAAEQVELNTVSCGWELSIGQLGKNAVFHSPKQHRGC